MSRTNPKHPYDSATSDMLRGVSAKNGSLAYVAGQISTASASDTVVTGLATVLACGAQMDDDPIVATEIATASLGDQAGTPAAGSILVKTWKTMGGTPAAATTFTKKVNWWAYGTPVSEIDDAA